MSTKRRAATELTKDNWDDEEEEVQEAGGFQVASSEDLSKRKIIKGKRRTTSGDNQGGGVFKGFKGFASFSTSTLPKSDVLLPSSSGATPFTSTSTTMSEVLSKPPVPSFLSKTTTLLNSTETSIETSSTTNGNSKTTPSYLEQIKSLNQSVTNWIQSHVTSNPYIDLTPVFKDYEKHMKDIDNKCCSAGSSNAPQLDTSSLPSSTQSIASSSSMRDMAHSSDTVSNLRSSSPQPVASSDTLVTSSASSSTQETDNGITTSNTAGNSEDQRKDENDDETSCKPDKLAGPEEGAYHSVRCKLYFKRASEWSELGVGMINLKDREGRTQILMRNDTSVGKILLNVFLASNTPVSRSGKNNVILVSAPNPPLFSKPSEGDNSKPATYLIRVKTADDADKLHAELITKKEAST